MSRTPNATAQTGQPRTKRRTSINERDESELRRLAASVPLWLYREWAGDRQNKTVNEQRDRYGLPIGPNVDLPAVIKWLHDFLAANKFRFVDDDPDISGPSSPALEELRRVKIEQERIRLAEMESRFVSRAILRELLGQLATQLRAASDRAESMFGLNGRELFNQALDATEAAIETLCVPNDSR